MRLFGITDQGLVRQNNQDNYIIAYNELGDVLIVVCDGMGGAKAGDIASYEAIQYFSEVFSENTGFKSLDDIQNYLKYHIRKSNELIFTLSTTSKQYEGMGTTIVGIVLTKKFKVGFNVGDSRIYSVDSRQLHQISTDHTYINELVQKGELSIERAKTHPKRNMLTRALGAFASVQADYYLLNGHPQYILLCSDGLHGLVRDEMILRIIEDSECALSDKANNLLKAALGAGGQDNVTLVLVQLKEDDYE